MRRATHILLLLVGVAVAAAQQLPPRQAMVHEPFAAWEVVTSAYAGDPYDVQAFAMFTHASGEAYRVPLFYDGDDTWRLRFTAPRVGAFEVATTSAHPGLDGLTTRLVASANPDPDATGFLVGRGDAFEVLVGDGTVSRRIVYNVYQRHDASSDPDGVETAGHLSDDPAVRGPHIEALLDEVEAHGMQALFLMVGNNWFSWPRDYDEAVPRDEADRLYPDGRTFEILEDLLARAHARGLFLHLWAWGDAENRNAPDGFGGINALADVRLQYYVAGRLGSLPNWTMGLGYDLEEWVTPEEARTWHANLTGFNTLPRLVGAREFGTWRDQTFELGAEKLGYFSNDLRPESSFFENARALFEGGHAMPVLYERRFLHTRDGVWDQETTVRALWQFTLAGGAGGIWGVLWGPGPEYPDAAPFRTHRGFWAQRFAADLDFAGAHRLDDATIALHRADGAAAVFYAEGTTRVALDLSGAGAPRRAVAVDARAPYAEIDLGLLGPTDDAWLAPYASTWVVAVGSF